MSGQIGVGWRVVEQDDGVMGAALRVAERHSILASRLITTSTST